MIQEHIMELMYDKIISMDNRLQRMDDKIQSMDDKIQSMDAKIQSMDDKIQSMDAKIQSMDDKIQSMDKDIKELKSSVQSLERRVTKIELTLENEIRHNISIIAENHVELGRKFNEVLKHDCERETALIRLNMLETKVRDLSEKEEAVA